MIAADIVDDAEIRAIAGEGPVRLARLGDRRAILEPGREPAGNALADPRRAADDGGGPAAGLDEPRHQAGHGALAAGPADRHARTAGIDELGQESGSREHGDRERARRPPLGRLRLDGRRVYEAVEVRADRRAIVRHERDAFAAQQGRGLQHQALVEGAVGPLHAVPARSHEPGQRIHPGSGHAGEVVVQRRHRALQRQVFVRREVRVPGDRRHLSQARSDADQERRLQDGREHRALVHELLDLVQHGLAPLLVHLLGLVAKERIDVRVAAVRPFSRRQHTPALTADQPGCATISPTVRQLLRLDLEALLAECEQAAREDGEAERDGDPEEDQAEEVDGDHGRRVLRRWITVRSGSFGSAPSRARPSPRHNGQGKVARSTRSR